MAARPDVYCLGSSDVRVEAEKLLQLAAAVRGKFVHIEVSCAYTPSCSLSVQPLEARNV